jgi:hypothetical protein
MTIQRASNLGDIRKYSIVTDTSQKRNIIGRIKCNRMWHRHTLSKH